MPMVHENGYDLELINAICDRINIPVIASGGCGSKKDILEVFKKTQADAAFSCISFPFWKSKAK